MGNNPSKSGGSQPQSPATTTHPREGERLNHGSVRKKDSVPALSQGKGPAAPATASFESATGIHSTTSTSNPTSRTTRPRTPSTARSNSATTPYLKPQDTTSSTNPANSNKMGSEQSHEKALPREKEKARDPGKEPGQTPTAAPLNVPGMQTSEQKYDGFSPIDPNDSSVDRQYHLPPSQAPYARPPRLPLPIEEEVHTPGSPIISPADLQAPIEGEPDLARRTSMLSSVAGDDDEEGDVDELRTLHGGLPAVPVVIEWKGPGDKVYVTGSFAGWEKKFRLDKEGPKKDALSREIPLAPGTHHLNFIVDGDSQLSTALPTAVDYTNTLINYIEVSPEQVPASSTTADAETPQPTEPVTTAEPPAKPLPKPEYKVPAGVHPPQVLPPTPDQKPAPTPDQRPASALDTQPPADGSRPAPV
ncbi:hypothetical protein LTS18_005652, partial [Coniosporium uncinatum]